MGKALVLFNDEVFERMSLVGRQGPIALHHGKVRYQGPLSGSDIQIYRADAQITESYQRIRQFRTLYLKMKSNFRISRVY